MTTHRIVMVITCDESDGSAVLDTAQEHGERLAEDLGGTLDDEMTSVEEVL